MKTLQPYLFTLLTVLFTSNYLQAQNNDNEILVKQVYEVLQNKNTTPNEVAALTNGINWEEVSNTKGIKSKYHISLSAIIKNEWESILFKNLSFQLPEKNKVLVTGTVKGRQTTECEFIATQFKHSWSLKNGKIIGFLE